MLSFIQYLTEVKRDNERAVKLGLYLAQRHNKYRSHLAPQWRQRKDTVFLDKYTKKPPLELHDRDPYTTHDLPVHSLHPIQDTVNWNDSKSHAKIKDKTPIDVVYHAKTDKHYIWNGHHRWLAAKLRGDKTIKANVTRKK